LLMLGVVALLLLGVVAVFAFGQALGARGKHQRGADLAAVSAAQVMRELYPRLFEPPLLENGLPNPRHLPLPAYLARARAAAVRGGRRNGVRVRRSEVSFPGASFAPTRVAVVVRGVARVRVGSGERRIRVLLARGGRAKAASRKHGLRDSALTLPRALGRAASQCASAYAPAEWLRRSRRSPITGVRGSADTSASIVRLPAGRSASGRAVAPGGREARTSPCIGTAAMPAAANACAAGRSSSS
jgi:hypothetical protein